ncbi:Ig-like domain-containing protein [Salinibacterium sp. M195]|uniref:OmpL47-type beta-barrel domain-containing protein n=1 Tax=Salinibacterium sp. M195 TaxID=2583374 RepID=UPI001C62B4D6|nr:Ig-like domain-containing protein [Salinibacterium sp. M195]
MSPIRKVIAGIGAGAILVGGGLISASPAVAAPGPATVVNVMDSPYNAVGDGITSDSAAIQAAVDDVTGTGATVLIPKDFTFLTSGVIIGSESTLQVEGTLLQSQNVSDYSYAVATGHRPGSLRNDLSSFQNLPFVFATDSQNVNIIGDGVIQLTRASTEAQTIHTIGVGIFEVDGFEIRDVEILGASSYTVGLYSSRNGILADTRIIPGSHYGATPDVADANTDGVSIMNSQNVRVTGNYIRASDDGIYIWANYLDPRSIGRWWYKAEPEASRFIEFDNNDVAVTCCKAFTFIVWGIDAPDQRTVEISDIYIHDNKLDATDAVGCWCDARYPNSSASEGQSPVTRITFENNEYIGNVDKTFATAQITDLKTDFGAFGSRTLMNGGFEETGIAWWSGESTNSDDFGAITVADAAVLRSAEARTALSSLSNFAGYVQAQNATPVRLYQGIGMEADALPEVPFPTNVYEVSADIVTGGSAAQLFAYDTCAAKFLGQRSVSASVAERISFHFRAESDCENVQVGIQTAGDGAWALIDNVVLDSVVDAIDNDDSTVAYTGSWTTYSNAGAWGGTNAIARNAGAAVEIPFTGTRAVLLALKDHNLGIARIYLDGDFVGDADFYAPTKLTGKLIYDTGELADGNHTIRVEYSDTKNPASVGTIIVFDAVLMPTELPDLNAPSVAVDVTKAGGAGWFGAGAALSVSASDLDSGVELVEFRVDGGAWAEFVSPVSLADGQYSVSARATDAAGNVSDVVTQQVKVDSVAPEVWVRIDLDGAVSTFARDAGLSGIDRMEYSLDAGTTWLDGLSALIAEDASPSVFEYRAVDVAGNASVSATASESAVVEEIPVAADDVVLVEFSGFDVGDDVRVELHSDPVLLGTFAANSFGVVSAVVTVPSSFPSGMHSFLGALSAANTVDPGVAAAGATAGELGYTGSDPMPLALGGLMMLLLGVGVAVMARLRRQRELE